MQISYDIRSSSSSILILTKSKFLNSNFVIFDFFPFRQLFISKVVANKHCWSSDFQAKTVKMPRPMQKIEKSTFFLIGLEENQDHFNVWRVERRLFFAKTTLLQDDLRISYEIWMYILKRTPYTYFTTVSEWEFFLMISKVARQLN